MPYFLSNSITEAITTEEQSVSGMKPIFTSFFSGASDPAAHAPTRTASGTMLSPAAPAFFRNSLLRTLIHDLPRRKKRRWNFALAKFPNAFVRTLQTHRCARPSLQRKRYAITRFASKHG